LDHLDGSLRAGRAPESKKGLVEQGLDALIGGDEEDRTPDLRIANATLSQLSYAPISP